MKVFISGAISGIADNNRPAFDAAEAILQDSGICEIGGIGK